MNAIPRKAGYRENLLYEFEDLTDSSATLSLLWEELCVPVRLKMDMNEIVLEEIRSHYLRSTAGFGWQGYNQAAQYCLTHNITLAEAEMLRERALHIATEDEMNAIGYQYLFSDRVDEAIEVFRSDVRLFPDSWNVYDSLAEGLARRGDTEEAINNYTRAMEMVEAEAQKERIRRTIRNLKEELWSPRYLLFG